MPKEVNITATAASTAVSAVETPAPVTVPIPIEDAEQIYELFKNVELADIHFHTCQSVNFRDHVKSVYKAPKVSAAFAGLKQEIEQAKGV